jgi:hypothetical protein
MIIEGQPLKSYLAQVARSLILCVMITFVMEVVIIPVGIIAAKTVPPAYMTPVCVVLGCSIGVVTCYLLMKFGALDYKEK